MKRPGSCSPGARILAVLTLTVMFSQSERRLQGVLDRCVLESPLFAAACSIRPPPPPPPHPTSAVKVGGLGRPIPPPHAYSPIELKQRLPEAEVCSVLKCNYSTWSRANTLSSVEPCYI